MLFSILVSLVTSWADHTLDPNATGIEDIAVLVLFLPGLAVAGRRLHDIGRAGWWLPVFLTARSGPVPNRYGGPAR